MENLNGVTFTLPEGWLEKLINAPKIAPRRPTDAFIRSLRKAFGITLTDLCIELDVDLTTVSRWERGISQPQGFSQQEERLNDWGMQIYMIQNIPPEQWKYLLPLFRSSRSRKQEEQPL
jgi:Helix-turn-helix